MSRPTSMLSPAADPRGSARWLREALRYQQMRNRLAAADYRAGVQRAKDIGAARRALAVRARRAGRARRARPGHGTEPGSPAPR
jgi:hypothetical protein